MDDNTQQLTTLAREMAAALNAYEAHRFEGIADAGRGINIGAHDDARVCSDTSAHNPWRDIVRHWPHFSQREKARRGDLHSTTRRELITGAEVAVLASGNREVIVRYVATDKRWVIDETLLAGG